MERVLQAVLAGAVAALITSVLIWLLSVTQLLVVLGVPIDASGVGLFWFVWRIVRGAAWALLFLIPVLRGRPEWQRGLLVGVPPALKLLLYDYPAEGRGLFGLESGVGLPLGALFFWLLWGTLAGLILARLLARDEAEAEAAAGNEGPRGP